MRRLTTLGLTFSALVSLAGAVASAQTLSPRQQRAVDIYKELVEINTVTATGDTARAADAMAARLRAAGFPDADVQVFKPAPHKGNLVARLHGTGARKPSSSSPISTSSRRSRRTGRPIPSSSWRRTATTTAAARATTSSWRRPSSRT
jgi:hypothetical protein